MLITRYKAIFRESVERFVHVIEVDAQRYEVTTAENFFPAWCTKQRIAMKLKSLGYHRYRVDSLPREFIVSWFSGSLVFRRV